LGEKGRGRKRMCNRRNKWKKRKVKRQGMEKEVNKEKGEKGKVGRCLPNI